MSGRRPDQGVADGADTGDRRHAGHLPACCPSTVNEMPTSAAYQRIVSGFGVGVESPDETEALLFSQLR